MLSFFSQHRLREMLCLETVEKAILLLLRKFLLLDLYAWRVNAYMLS